MTIDAQIRQVFFFDTPDLALGRAGVGVDLAGDQQIKTQRALEFFSARRVLSLGDVS